MTHAEVDHLLNLLAIKAVAENVDWRSLTDKGSEINWYNLPISEHLQILQVEYQIKSLLHRRSARYYKIRENIAENLSQNPGAYDCYCKLLSRLLSDKYENVLEMLSLSLTVRTAMKEKGLTEISSLEELFPEIAECA